MTPKPYRKPSNPPSLENRHSLTKRLLESISRHSGFSIEEFVKSGKRKHIWWRRVGIWILIEDYGGTHQAVADVFKCATSTIHHSFTVIDVSLRNKMCVDSYLPYINKVTEDLAL